MFTYTARDSAASPNMAMQTFRISVPPALMDLTPIANQTFAVGTAVNLTLPAAIGGIPNPVYTLTGPNGTDLTEVPGLTFDANTRELTPTPANYPARRPWSMRPMAST